MTKLIATASAPEPIRQAVAAVWITVFAAGVLSAVAWGAMIYLLVHWFIYTVTTATVAFGVTIAVVTFHEHHTRPRRTITLAELREVIGEEDFRELIGRTTAAGGLRRRRVEQPNTPSASH